MKDKALLKAADKLAEAARQWSGFCIDRDEEGGGYVMVMLQALKEYDKARKKEPKCR